MSSRLLKGLPRLELLEVVTVGLPFCGFKVLTGLFIARAGATSFLLELLGAALVVLGALDLVINLLNLITLLVKRHRAVDACLFGFFARVYGKRSRHPRWTWQDFGNSIDVLLSFILVAFVVGFGVLKKMPADEVAQWNICVVMNVLGAGIGRFGASLKNILPNE